MKRRLMLAAMSLILTVTLSVTSMNTVAEASPKMSPTEENLEITINSFLESDGAVAEELTDEMLKTFLETPLDFLRVIDTYPLDKQELLLSRIANVAVRKCAAANAFFKISEFPQQFIRLHRNDFPIDLGDRGVGIIGVHAISADIQFQRLVRKTHLMSADLYRNFIFSKCP